MAGTAKLRRRGATERAFRRSGLTAPAALAVGVPVVELALAAGLVVVPAEAGVAALALLAGFTTFLVRSMRRGESGGCGCFGTSRPGAVTSAELVRNAVLALAAALACFAPQPVVPGAGAVAVVAAGAAAGVWSTAFARRRSASVVPPRQGPPTGAVAPSLPGVVLDGTAMTLVAFVAPSCAGCAELRSSLGAGGAQRLRTVVVDLDDASAATYRDFGVLAPPYLVVLGGDGRVRASGAARSTAEVEALLRQAGAG